ncbi:hypothetical protein HY838_00395 [Candidatus Azambacteria bacterium]|nr:hypothetical protein [Candidatus Azambacteria bacterium]
MKSLFKNPLFYINIFLLTLIFLLVVSINVSQTKLPSFVKKAIAAVQSITGAGSVNYLAAFSDTNQIGNSIIYDNGSNVGIGTAGPITKLDVAGDIHASDWIFTPNNMWANDYYINSIGRWASQVKYCGFYITQRGGQAWLPNQFTGGFSCPAGCSVSFNYTTAGGCSSGGDEPCEWHFCN